MKRLLLSALLILSACGVAATPEAESVETLESEIIDEPVTFEAVLDEYKALNSRLERVAYQLQSANVDLCPRQMHSLGFTVHTIWDYPEHLRDVARVLLPASDAVSLRTIRQGSPADQLGLQIGDILISLNGSYFPRGQTASQFYNLASARAFKAETVDLIVERGGERHSYFASPERLCGYPVNVFFSERINGHTDGEEVWITSELMRTVPDNVNLALVVAHEMAHAMAGHMDQVPSKRLELEADRMALIMLERAGFDIDRAISYWAQAPHPHGEPELGSSHPSIQERLTHFQAVRESIRAKQLAGETLNLD